MSQTIQERQRTLPSRKRTILGSVLALIAAMALALGVSTPSFAATGAVTGDWDVLATSQSQTPLLKSYDHDANGGAGAWDTVTPSAAWYAVGSGKFIDGSPAESTVVSGGGFRFQNTATTSKTATFVLTVPLGTGLTITDPTTGAAIGTVTPSGTSRAITLTTGTIGTGATFHKHYNWQFSGSTTSVTISVTVTVSGSSVVGSYVATSAYQFKF